LCENFSLTFSEKCRLRVFENRVLRRTFESKRDEVTGEWRRLHNKELYALYSSPNIIRVMKSRRLRWAGHVARMGRGEVHAGFWWGNLREGDHLQDSGIDWRIILNWILEKWDMRHRLGTGCCECGDGPSGSIKSGDFLE
jgi:hypothetical protein